MENLMQDRYDAWDDREREIVAETREQIARQIMIKHAKNVNLAVSDKVTRVPIACYLGNCECAVDAAIARGQNKPH